LLAVCIFGQILLGWFLEDIPRGTPARSWYVNLHKSIGLTLGALIVFRLSWRLRHSPPPLPTGVPRWQRVAASISHYSLYACMLLLPFSGYVASNFSEYGVRYFNAILLPPWGSDDERVYAFFNAVHVATSYAFVTLIALHVAGGVSHAVSGDGVFRRMLPRMRTRDGQRR
ncbi:MAG TPA: cytochrome b, partial [Nitrospiraceae bacterium]|nr:cytochrome b [Nitrospiraceae bacterium]